MNVYLRRPSEDGGIRSRPNPKCTPIELHCTIIRKTTISELKSSAILKHCITICYESLNIWSYKHSPLFYIILQTEQKCVRWNIIRNSNVYCLVSVFHWFVIILRFTFFLLPLWMAGWWRLDKVQQEAALPMLCYIVLKMIVRSLLYQKPLSHAGYIQDVTTTCGTVILPFHVVSNL